MIGLQASSTMHGQRRRTRWHAVLLVAWAACAPNRGALYEQALQDARIANHDGRFEAAARSFAQASKTAKVPRDAVYARYEAALAWARAGDVAHAATELRAIATSRPPSAYSSQAALKAADLTRANDEARAVAEYERVIVDFPESGVAQAALGHILRYHDGQSAENALQTLESLAPRARRTAIEEKIQYERAKRLAQLERTESAREAFLEVANKWPYPFGSLNDDALFFAAEMEVKLGRPKEAMVHLERLLSQREVSSFIGSYERPKYVPALLKIAELSEALGDRPRARAALHLLYEDFTTSTMRDDALWREAALWREDGKKDIACVRLSTLAKDFPDSRYVPCVTVYCPEVRRQAASKAPNACHDYLLRDKTTNASK